VGGLLLERIVVLPTHERLNSSKIVKASKILVNLIEKGMFHVDYK